VAKLTKREITSFHRHVDGLNKLIEQVRKRMPQACYYIADGRLELMSASSHANGEPQPDRILEGASMPYADGGGW